MLGSSECGAGLRPAGGGLLRRPPENGMQKCSVTIKLVGLTGSRRLPEPAGRRPAPREQARAKLAKGVNQTLREVRVPPRCASANGEDEEGGHGHGDGVLIGFHTRLKPKPWKSLTFERDAEQRLTRGTIGLLQFVRDQIGQDFHQLTTEF